ncbi:MAG: lipopolysaccharide assembly protein LapB [Chromatiales bacterium]
MFLEGTAGLFWLLLPVAAISGWFAARRDQRRRPASTPKRLAPDYFKGINYLLNEQPDKAIEVFIKMLDVESETVETHLALGNLFRRRGEVDRAIRIHQNLIARTQLTDEERTLAVLELGMDYMRSGLLDRAEGLFKQLLEAGVHTRQALAQLVDIYQQEQDWDRAIEYARRLESARNKSLRQMIAHYYCEQAEETLRSGDIPAAERASCKALEEDPSCVRASLLLAEVALRGDDREQAIHHYQRIERQDEDFIPEAIEPLLQCYRALGRTEECADYLNQLARKHAGITPVLALAELIAERDGVDAAIEYLTTELRKRPSVRGLDRLVHYTLASADGRARDNLLLLTEFTRKLLESKSVYRCSTCGFTGKLVHWQCPGCKQWNTVKPIHGIEGE